MEVWECPLKRGTAEIIGRVYDGAIHIPRIGEVRRKRRTGSSLLKEATIESFLDGRTGRRLCRRGYVVFPTGSTREIELSPLRENAQGPLTLRELALGCFRKCGSSPSLGFKISGSASSNNQSITSEGEFIFGGYKLVWGGIELIRGEEKVSRKVSCSCGLYNVGKPLTRAIQVVS